MTEQIEHMAETFKSQQLATIAVEERLQDSRRLVEKRESEITALQVEGLGCSMGWIGCSRQAAQRD